MRKPLPKAERAVQVLPMDPKVAGPYRPSWFGDSRGYDQSRENPPTRIGEVTISVVGSKGRP